jgi:O-antigen/teichoic acid export membrane protein
MTMSLKSRALKGTVWVGLATYVSLILNFSLTLVLAKVLSPTEWGLIGITNMIILTTLRLNEAAFGQSLIYRTKNVTESANTVFLLAIMWGAGIWLVILLAAAPIARFFNAPAASSLIRTMGIVIPISAFAIAPAALLEKSLNFRTKVIPEITSLISYALLAIALGAFGWGAWSVVCARIAQAIISTTIVWLISGWRPQRYFNRSIASEVMDYGKDLLAASVLVVIFLNIDYVFVGRLLGTTVLGYYVFAFTLANFPREMISPVIQRVSFPLYVRVQHDKQRLTTWYMRTLKYSALLAFPAAMGLIAVTPDFLAVFSSGKWLPAALLVQIFSVYGLFRSLVALSSNVLMAVGKQALLPRLQFVYVMTVAILLWPAITHLGAPGASLMMTVVQSIGSIIALALVNHHLSISWTRLLKTLAPSFLASMAMLGVIVLVRPYLAQTFLTVLIEMVVGGSIYLVSLLIITGGAIYHDIADLTRPLLQGNRQK